MEEFSRDTPGVYGRPFALFLYNKAAVYMLDNGRRMPQIRRRHLVTQGATRASDAAATSVLSCLVLTVVAPKPIHFDESDRVGLEGGSSALAGCSRHPAAATRATKAARAVQEIKEEEKRENALASKAAQARWQRQQLGAHLPSLESACKSQFS